MGDDAYTVEHAMGSTVVDGTPERIVVIDSPHLDALVALGITPVGATESGAAAGFPGYLADELDGTTSVGLTMEPDLEAIANLAPDLIIGAKVRHEALYEQLSAIAPTVFSENSGTDWQEQADITAAAVNRSDEMDTLLTAVSDRAVEVGEKVGADGRTASIVRFRPENFRLYGPSTFSGSILTQVGFDLGQRDWNEYSMLELSPEMFPQIDGDVVFFTNPSGDPNVGTMATVTGLWGAQPAVAAGNVHEMEDETWMVGIGVVGANLILDQIESALA
ncbi:ABC transporter substrate-binding protein [Rhodococcus phenolicus]|uniref:ABC transporter substrate-binding protein n=1 Tax=Rhodococcus phenolicus TaxID=263849 RepID=UPI001FE14BD1|nr:iron-siderophore ABC transporter substrate-binding protein [Rhodococcus phenolicus]